MTKNEYGVFEVTVPAKDGKPAIPHNSKIKVGCFPMEQDQFMRPTDLPCRTQ
jgi:hypothetical protein